FLRVNRFDRIRRFLEQQSLQYVCDMNDRGFTTVFRRNKIRRKKFRMLLKLDGSANLFRQSPRSKQRGAKLGGIQRIDEILFFGMRALHDHLNAFPEIMKQSNSRDRLRLLFSRQTRNLESEHRNDA